MFETLAIHSLPYGWKSEIRSAFWAVTVEFTYWRSYIWLTLYKVNAFEDQKTQFVDINLTVFRPVHVWWQKRYWNFAEYNQQYTAFHNLFISVRCSTCFRRFFRPSSGWAPDNGRKNRLKHVGCLTEINWETWHLVGCILRIYLRCTDLWMSNNLC